MATAMVKKILEYKNHNNVDFFLVIWHDNTTSWVSASNLKCKDMIIEFVESAIKIIGENERMMAQRRREQNEKEMLEKLMLKNEKDVIKIESKNLEHINGILNQVKNNEEPRVQKIGNHAKDFYNLPNKNVENNSNLFFLNGMANKGFFDNKESHKNEIFKNKYQSGNEIFNNQFKKISQNVFEKEEPKKVVSNISVRDEIIKSASSIPYEPPVKKQVSRLMKINSAFIKLTDEEFLTINFYCSEDMPVLNFDISFGSFIDLDQISSCLFLNYYKGYGYNFYPSDDTSDLVASQFEEILKNHNLFYIQKIENTVWGLCASNGNQNFLKIEVKSRFVIFKFDNNEKLNYISSIKNFALPNTLWVKDTFKLGNQLFGNFLFKDNSITLGKSIFIFDDERSSSHLISYAKNYGEIVNNLDYADTVLVSEIYLNFLHLIPKFYVAIRKNIRFYLVNNFLLSEILPNGGLITFSSDYLQNVELLILSDFLDLISRKKNWEIKISKENFQAFEKRLNEQKTDPTFLHKVKKIYQFLSKSLYLEFYDGDLRDHLESVFYKTHRFFFTISTLKFLDGTVSMEDACQIIANH